MTGPLSFLLWFAVAAIVMVCVVYIARWVLSQFTVSPQATNIVLGIVALFTLIALISLSGGSGVFRSLW